MSNKLLSIIIPSYNMEKYLDDCIGSIVKSKHIDDIEVIIVNDGSKDTTSEIAHGWESKYPKSVCVYDKENGGHGSAINYGAYVCAGKYFKIIDADDWVDTDELDKLMEKLNITDVDCVICNYNEVYESTGKSEIHDCISGFEIGIPIQLGEYVDKYNLRLHSLTYKTEIYRSGEIYVREKCFFDDAQYCLYAYAVVSNVECYPFNVYQYRLQREGQSVSPQGFLKHLDDHYKIVLDLCEFSKTVEVADNVRNALIKTIGDHIQFQYSFIAKYGSKEQLKSTKLFNKKIKTEYDEVYKNMDVKRGGKLLHKLNFGHYNILKIIRKLFLKNRV